MAASETTTEVSADNLAGLQALLDRQAIIDCTYRYCRGVDRLDEQLVLSAFHDDAMIREKTVRDFFAYIAAQRDVREACQHYATNHSIEFDGDTAHVETYFMSVMKMRDDSDAQSLSPAAPEAKAKDEISLLGGRYVDRFEKRDGEWKIALRVGISEWLLVGDGSRNEQWISVRGDERARDRSDLSYERPLLNPSS